RREVNVARIEAREDLARLRQEMDHHRDALCAQIKELQTAVAGLHTQVAHLARGAVRVTRESIERQPALTGSASSTTFSNSTSSTSSTLSNSTSSTSSLTSSMSTCSTSTCSTSTSPTPSTSSPTLSIVTATVTAPALAKKGS